MDRILESFLKRQQEEGLGLAADSDIVDLLPIGENPPQRYIAEFHCRGLVQTEEGEIRPWNRFTVGIFFASDYLRAVDPFAMFRLFGPPTPEHPNVHVWHPNVSARAPILCPGKILPGMSLTDLLHQLYELFSFQRFNPREDDCLNRFCCAWARSNADRFPVDNRPMRRRTLNLEVV